METMSPQEDYPTKRMLIGTAIGLAIGVAIGIAINNIGAGIAMGVPLGVGCGLVLVAMHKKNEDRENAR